MPFYLSFFNPKAPPKQDIRTWINSIQRPDFSLKNSQELCDISPRVLAEQMTILEAKIIQRIVKSVKISTSFNHFAFRNFLQEPNEFHKQVWNKKTAATKAPWLNFYIDFFNQRSRFFSTVILKEENLNSRIVFVEKIIDTLAECVSLQNFNGALEISACLFSTPIARLKKTWKGISERHKQIVKEFEVLLSPMANYRAYREKLKVTSLETIYGST